VNVAVLWEIAFRLILLHSPGGLVIAINPDEIVTLKKYSDEEHRKGTVHEGAHCVINTVDGKFSAVVETCAKVYEMAKEPSEQKK
jgi:hypothetical protein